MPNDREAVSTESVFGLQFKVANFKTDQKATKTKYLVLSDREALSTESIFGYAYLLVIFVFLYAYLFKLSLLII